MKNTKFVEEAKLCPFLISWARRSQSQNNGLQLGDMVQTRQKLEEHLTIVDRSGTHVAQCET